MLGNHHSGLRKSFLKDYLITTIVLFDSNSFPSFPPTLTERSWPVVTILAKGETRSNQIQSFSALRFCRLTSQDQPVKATPAGAAGSSEHRRFGSGTTKIESIDQVNLNGNNK